TEGHSFRVAPRNVTGLRHRRGYNITLAENSVRVCADNCMPLKFTLTLNENEMGRGTTPRCNAVDVWFGRFISGIRGQLAGSISGSLGAAKLGRYLDAQLAISFQQFCGTPVQRQSLRDQRPRALGQSGSPPAAVCFLVLFGHGVCALLEGEGI